MLSTAEDWTYYINYLDCFLLVDLFLYYLIYLLLLVIIYFFILWHTVIGYVGFMDFTHFTFLFLMHISQVKFIFLFVAGGFMLAFSRIFIHRISSHFFAGGFGVCYLYFGWRKLFSMDFYILLAFIYLFLCVVRFYFLVCCVLFLY